MPGKPSMATAAAAATPAAPAIFTTSRRVTSSLLLIWHFSCDGLVTVPPYHTRRPFYGRVGYIMKRYLAVSGLAAVAVLAILLAQQPGGVDELRARAKQDLANQAAYASEPGGTPEDRTWEALILLGAGDT